MWDISKEVSEHREKNCTNAVPDGYKRRDASVYVLDNPGLDQGVVNRTHEILETAQQHDGVVLSTGGTFESIYEVMGEQKAHFEALLKGLVLINQDELYVIDEEDRLSYTHYMRARLFSALQEPIRGEWIIPDPSRPPEEALAAFHRQLIAVNRVKLGLLGIGPDAKGKLKASPHIGFIAPDTPLDSFADIVKLDHATRCANGDKETYPRKAITHGPANVLRTQALLAVAKGSRKKQNMADVVLGDFSPAIPSTLMQIVRADIEDASVEFFLDTDAAGVIMTRMRHRLKGKLAS